MQSCGGTWVAHDGGTGDRLVVEAGNKVMVPPNDPKYALWLLWLTEQEEQGYYYGFSNDGLWPLCHNAYTEPTFEYRDWQTYKRVNQLFAGQILVEIGSKPPRWSLYRIIIWPCCQDYCARRMPRLSPANSGIFLGPIPIFFAFVPGRKRY